MRVFYGFDNLAEFRRPVVTVGSFDGVHRGHMVLIGRVLELARANKGESVIVTFSPHPREVLDPEGVKLLTTVEEKIQLLEKAGVNNLIVIPFDAEFSHTSHRDFVKEYLVDRVGMADFVAGYNHHFGAGKQGGPDSAQALAEEFGYNFYPVERQQVDGSKVSSTVIRQEIEGGNIREAAKLLGHNYFAICTLGRCGELTCENEAKLLPLSGVYPVIVHTVKDEFNDEVIVSNKGSIFLSAKGWGKVRDGYALGARVNVEFL